MKTVNEAARDAKNAYRATEFLHELQTVFRNTPVQSVTHGKFPVARSTLYSWRAGNAFHITPHFLLLLDSLGYRLRIERIPDKERDGR